MSLDELTNLLDGLLLETPSNDTLITKIIHLMYEASETGINNLTYHFQDTSKILIIKEKLLTYFPDLEIYHTPNTNYIVIDWS